MRIEGSNRRLSLHWTSLAEGNLIQKIEELQPDLVFLDLQMRVMGGFEVVKKLEGGHLPVVVIVKFDEHAVEAFEAGAVDYLLKPMRLVSPNRSFKNGNTCVQIVPAPVLEDFSGDCRSAVDFGF